MIKFDLNDITIKPSVTTRINSRKEVNPYYGDKLPIFTAPMDTVIDLDNYEKFIEYGLNVVLPRGLNIDDDRVFTSVSLDDFITDYIVDTISLEKPKKILIDIANGHLIRLHETIKQAKEKYGDNLIIMAGNIANPETYRVLSECGADYIRLSIGSGSGCLSSEQLGVNFPLASLISECYQISLELEKPAKIIADGGMKSYSDIIKSLALGADYVMIGGLLNKTIESCGQNYYKENGSKFVEVSYQEGLNHFNKGDLGSGKIYKKFRGMSTKEVQKEWGKEKLTTSEGIVKYNEVEYTLKGWVENLTDYLRSAMSYTDSLDLEEFKDSEIIQITDNAYKRFNK